MSDLTAQQALGMQKIKDWYDGMDGAYYGDAFRWFGYAGTGKTYSAARVPEALGIERVAFGTYTGKAASVLRRSLAKYGVSYPVTTIHSAVYFPTTSAEARKELADARDELGFAKERRDDIEDYVASGKLEAKDGVKDELTDLHRTIAELEARIPELEANARRLQFEFNPEGPWRDLDLIILDEVSMVNAKLASDIESYGVPILVLGDPAQLPPVEGGGYYTNAEPDHLLTDVQRQALESPVLELATRIRTSTTGRLGITEDDTTPASVRAAMEADQVLCWTNKRRWALLDAIRRQLGRPQGQPVAGDRIMCLTNNKDLAIFNGEQFTVLDSTPGTMGPTLTVQTETGLHRDIPTFIDGFLGRDMQDQAKQSGAGRTGNRMLATFAQAITVHKAQGSEWGHVYIANETPAMISMTAKRQGSRAAVEQARQWLYTGVTRARDKATITAPR